MPGRESDEAYAQRILAKADKYLEQVDEAFILKQRGHSERAMPTFRPEEISLGPVLGTGGFGVVNEILKFTLDASLHGLEQNDQKVDGSDEEAGAGGQDDDDGDLKEAPIMEIVVGGQENDGPTVGFGDDTDEDPSGKEQVVSNLASVSERGAHDFHYDVTKARHLMEKRAIRSGKARYALKRLHSDLTALERARGMIDLAVEAKYLSIVWHPNISKFHGEYAIAGCYGHFSYDICLPVKMRGVAKGPMVDQDFFIILDRLIETLDKRMNTWFTLHRKYTTSFCDCGKNKKGLAEMQLEAMTIAYDLAAAFFYLHENRYVFNQ